MIFPDDESGTFQLQQIIAGTGYHQIVLNYAEGAQKPVTDIFYFSSTLSISVVEDSDSLHTC